MLNKLEKALGYKFRDPELLRMALTHTSCANEIYQDPLRSYERLEFLGDSIVGFVTAEYLYRTFPKKLEGDLTRIRAELVCEKSLAAVAERLSLGEHLLLGNGEDQSGGRRRPLLIGAGQGHVPQQLQADGMEGAVNAIVSAVREAGPNACPPVVVGVGIGGTFEKAALMAKQALTRPVGTHSEFPSIKAMEEEVLEKVNNLGIGAAGLGGTVTALAVNINTYPTHIAGLPVAVNMCCHVNRHAVRTL